MAKENDDVPKTYKPVEIPTPEQVLQSEIGDSCILRFFLSGLAGGVLGAGMGLIFGSFQEITPPGAEVVKRTMMESIKVHAKDAGARSFSYAKGFAAFGAVYSTSECAIEKVRAKHDIYNAGLAGCFTGGVLAIKAGPQAMAVGCGSIGAFSMAIEKFLDH
mmetsp:Transcript_29741/g.41072  ORF Transcript_29741/g.41072 Transcript_29741/m.41072 type:complete len:161 (+) Transcript_29741:160-642(+)|eukprot:CAMPEP_0196580266 /NCGR_PEP_ID=MMETSP1081-20130531/28123_1 /TAXON_ID=36882 /ORGANISM="Pyramimonas amylifera, Strain CCMP720" /LENGTH=160 /DNA_ID=CAMNT_0041900097 /DNA_START=146 /DNA_END=628 /DNA_ORIENTATION=-